LTASQGTYDYGVFLRWQASSHAKSYAIYRSEANVSSGAKLIGTTGNIQYWDASATPGLTYWYWVKAVNDYGNYYSWGETRPKDDYSLTNYQWWDNGFTKYCTGDEHGTTDHKSILDLSDDAANANWGSTWRTPTIEEIMELANRCQWHWTERNGVEGFQVTGPSGNSIFLPPAGYYEGSEGKEVNRHGLYWSSTLYTYGIDYNVDQRARCLFINNVIMEYHGIDAIERFKGFPVRPVIKIR
jgi:hypothetical protein